jgi:Kef-type K+ transport system membrane component KefB
LLSATSVFASVLVPIVAEGVGRFVAVPEVVSPVVFGIILGPYALALAHPNDIVAALSDFGLTYLMFLAGTELDLSRMKEGRMRLAAVGWGMSLVLALAVGGLLVASGLVHDRVVFALCLATTALGTLLPILRDAHVFESRFGPVVLSVGAVGEFGPVVAVAVLLTTKNAPVTIVLLALFVVIAAVKAVTTARVHPPRLVALLRRHLETTSQTHRRSCCTAKSWSAQGDGPSLSSQRPACRSSLSSRRRRRGSHAECRGPGRRRDVVCPRLPLMGFRQFRVADAAGSGAEGRGTVSP